MSPETQPSDTFPIKDGDRLYIAALEKKIAQLEAIAKTRTLKTEEQAALDLSRQELRAQNKDS